MENFSTIGKSEHRVFINYVATGDMEKVLMVHSKYGDQIASFLWKGKHYPFYYALKNGHYKVAHLFHSMDPTCSKISESDLVEVVKNSINDWNDEKNQRMLNSLYEFKIVDEEQLIRVVIRTLYYYPHRPFIQEGLCSWVVDRFGDKWINVILSELKETPAQKGLIKKLKRDITLSSLLK